MFETAESSMLVDKNWPFAAKVRLLALEPTLTVNGNLLKAHVRTRVPQDQLNLDEHSLMTSIFRPYSTAQLKVLSTAEIAKITVKYSGHVINRAARDAVTKAWTDILIN